MEHTRGVNQYSDVIMMQILTKKLAKDTLLYFPAKIIPGMFGVIGIAVFTRLFNPQFYGQYILIMTTTMIVTTFTSQWIVQSTLRYRAQYVSAGQTSDFNNKFALLLLCLTVVLACIALLTYPLRGFLGEYKSYFLVFWLVIVAGIWFNCLVTLYQADLKSWSFSIFTILNGILKFLVPYLLVILYNRTVSSLLWGGFFAFIIIIIPLILTSGIIPISRSQRTDPVSVNSMSLTVFIRQFFLYGFPMIGWFLGAELLSVADRYIIQIFRNSQEVGIYSSNYNLVVSAIALIATPLLNAAHPLLMKAGVEIERSKENVQQLIRSFSRYFLILSFPILVYIIVFARELADVFLGLEYRKGNIVMPVVLIGIFAWSFAMFGHKGLEFREKTRIMFVYVMICTVVKVVLNLLFVPRFGYHAAMTTTLLCFLLYPVLVYFGTRNDIAWLIPWGSMGRIILICIGISIFIWTIKFIPVSSFLKLLIAGLLLVPVYLTALWIGGEINDREKGFMKRMLARGL